MMRFTSAPDRGTRVLKVALPLAFWLGAWQLAATSVGKELFLPSPLAVVVRLLELAGTPLFWHSAGATLLRIFLGLVAGVLLGTILAALTCAMDWADWLLSPAIKLVQATPVASFILLLWLWVETGWLPGVISALMVLPVVWGNLSRGAAETDPLLLELAGAYHFGPVKTLRLVYIPSILPYFASGCRTALGLAWKAGVAAEVLCQPKSAIGTQVYFSKIYYETPSLFAWTLVVVALSFALEWAMGHGLKRMERRGKL